MHTTDTAWAAPSGYEIIDSHTGLVVGTAKSLKAATRSVDRRDNAYGAYRFRARPVACAPAHRCSAACPVSCRRFAQ